MIRVLHVISGMGSGGAEAMIMNWYRNIDRNKVQFDFLLRSSENIYAQEIGQLGGKVYYMPDFPKKILSNYLQTKAFLQKHVGEYAAIHVHCNALIYTNIFSLAKNSGIKKRIIHSHSTSTKSKLFLPLHLLNKKRIYSLATDFFACSEEAGQWCFEKEYTVIHNSIDVERFKYNEQDRARVRDELGIDHTRTKVICHVGRFLPVKNHQKLVHIFAQYYKKYPESKLLLVGTGPLVEDVKSLVSEKGLQDDVLFLGVRKDIPDILSASDCFIFPSIYEGLGISLIEAQTNGLYCLASQTIPKETKLTNNIKYIDINDSDDVWVEEIEKTPAINRLLSYESVKQGEYNIKNTVTFLQQEYLKGTQ